MHLKLEKILVIEFIDRYISCYKPLEHDDPEVFMEWFQDLQVTNFLVFFFFNVLSGHWFPIRKTPSGTGLENNRDDPALI